MSSSLRSFSSKNGDNKDNSPSDNGDDENIVELQQQKSNTDLLEMMGKSLQPPAGRLWAEDVVADDDDYMGSDRLFIPQVSLHESDGRLRKRVLVLCTGGTLTMAPDPELGGALAPVEGALSKYMSEMSEFDNPDMPDVVLHEYTPFFDSSDLGRLPLSSSFMQCQSTSGIYEILVPYSTVVILFALVIKDRPIGLAWLVTLKPTTCILMASSLCRGQIRWHTAPRRCRSC